MALSKHRIVGVFPKLRRADFSASGSDDIAKLAFDLQGR